MLRTTNPSPITGEAGYIVREGVVGSKFTLKLFGGLERSDNVEVHEESALSCWFDSNSNST